MRTCLGITKNLSFCKRAAGGKIYCHQHKSQLKHFLIVGLITILLSYISGIIPNPWKNDPIVKMAGVLVPDNAPTPPYNCGAVPPDAMILFLGNSVAYQIKPFPIDIFTVAGKSFLSIDKIKDKLFISAKIFSSDSKIVAEIKYNKFYINPNNYFYIERPNKHTLVVYDQQSRKVLDIYFINSKTVKILGIFNIPNRMPIVIEEEKQKIGIATSENSCFRQAVGAFFNI